MNVKLTDEAIRRYVAGGGVSCPYCGSENISAARKGRKESGG